jgi:hypothetical protein
MFISKTEKEQLWQAVQALQAKVRDLEIETIWLKNKLYKTKPPTLKTEEAPWGHKQDGTPRKRPGRKASPPSSLTDVVIL